MTDSNDLALCIDLGSSGLKVGLSTLDGRLLDSRQETLVTTFGANGAATQDAGEWWRLIGRCATRLTSALDVRRIVAVAITGQYASVVPVDEEGTPVGECVMWMDTRGGRHARTLVGGPVAGYKPSAAAAFIRRTGGAPSPAGADGAGGLLHLTYDRPEVLARARWLLEPIDYLAMRFSGRAAATHASMFGWWLCDNRNLELLSYDARLLALLKTSADRLAPLVAFGSVVGEVSVGAHASTGVPTGTPVIAGIPDIHAAALGSGTTAVNGPGHLALSTTSWISTPVSAKKTDARHSIVAMPGLDAGSYLVLNNHEIGAKALEWFAGALGESAPFDFERLTREAAGAAPGSGRVLFTPWLAGERSPIESHSARGGFHNLSLLTTRAEMVRATMEGVAYNSRWLLEYVDKFVGRELAPLRLLGGGASSPLWCQMHADVLDREVEQVASPMVAQLRGVALLAGRALGVVASDEVPALAQIAERFEPDAKNRGVYDELYAEFPALMKTQAGMFKRLQRRGQRAD